MRKLLFFIILSLGISILFGNVQSISAQTCTGDVTCCNDYEPTPKFCNSNNPCNGAPGCVQCTGYACFGTNSLGCSFAGGACGHTACGGPVMGGSCVYTPPVNSYTCNVCNNNSCIQVTQQQACSSAENCSNCGGGSGGGSGGSCSGGSNPECRTDISNCGQIGKVGGSGSCSNGGLCCVEPSGGGGAACNVYSVNGISDSSTPIVLYQNRISNLSIDKDGGNSGSSDPQAGLAVLPTSFVVTPPAKQGQGLQGVPSPTIIDNLLQVMSANPQNLCCLYGRNYANVSVYGLNPGTTTMNVVLYLSHYSSGTSGDVCNKYFTIQVNPPQCDISLSPSFNTISIGQTIPVTASVDSNDSSPITGVAFSTTNGRITATPTSDAASPYLTNITGISTGTVQFTATATTQNGGSCTVYSPTITVNNYLPGWWQTTGGDAVSKGSLSSLVPTSNVFSKDGVGGFPGNVIYGATTNLTAINTSSKNWKGNSVYGGKTYNSAAFLNNLPSNLILNTLPVVSGQSDFDSGTASPDGYYYYTVNSGSLTINGNLTVAGNKKIVVFVKGGSLNINGNIIIQTAGSGFFMTVVSGNTNVNATTTTLNGIFETDGGFNTGSGNTQLVVKGSVAAWGSVTLQRDLQSANSTTAGESFVFDPTLSLLFPPSLAQNSISWKELVP
ncbi:MAG TPA: hypothetical protein VG895_01675 [Patescibacteria group bacterium]|nr:hypothetical protein [Patescibacteria group bacterium]